MFDLQIPQEGVSAPLNVTVNPHRPLIVLGANGTGKSSLLLRFYQAHGAKAKRVVAHRQTWMESGSVSLSAQHRNQTHTNIQNQDLQEDSRHKDPYAVQRPSVALFDLVEKENALARKISRAARDEDIDSVVKMAQEEGAPLDSMNRLLELARMPFYIGIGDNQAIEASRILGGATYGIDRLSDGERSAVLMASEVLTAPLHALVLVDEPERHLHRAAIAPLLSQLFLEREDLSFVISTHEVELAYTLPAAQTLLVRSCRYVGGRPESWDVDLVADADSVDEAFKTELLGGRRRLLFVEGTTTSLDRPLYSILFPDMSVYPRGSCREVEQVVRGINAAHGSHRVMAWGIVDLDDRDRASVNRLKTASVFALARHSVESIYYGLPVRRAVAARQAATKGLDVKSLLSKAKAQALAELSKDAPRLAKRAALKAVRQQVFGQLPSSSTIAKADPISLKIDVQAVIDGQLKALRSLIAAGDLEHLIARYPCRETNALQMIAKALGFSSRVTYQAAALRVLQDSLPLRRKVLSWFGELPAQVLAHASSATGPS